MSRVQHNGSNKNMYKEKTKTKTIPINARWGLDGAESTRDVQMNQIQKYKPLIAFERKQYLSQDKPWNIRMNKYLHVLLLGSIDASPLGYGAISRAWNDGSKHDQDQDQDKFETRHWQD